MIRRQVVVPAAPAAVWEFITAPDTPDSWLGGHLEWTAEEGADLRFEGDDGKVRRGVVEAVRPPRYIRYRWWPEDEAGEPESEVAYLLEPEPDSDEGETRLTVSERVAPAPGSERPGGIGPAASASVAAAPGAPPRLGGEEEPAASGSWTAGDDRRFRAWAGAHALVVRS